MVCAGTVLARGYRYLSEQVADSPTWTGWALSGYRTGYNLDHDPSSAAEVVEEATNARRE
jgi:hypothetical protein